MGWLCLLALSASTYPGTAFVQPKNFHNWLIITLLTFVLMETTVKPEQGAYEKVCKEFPSSYYL